jgi:hypothetical protein
MLRYAFALTLALGTIAGVAAAVEASAARTVQAATTATHETIVEKNSPFPVLGPIVVEECATEDCSDYQS